MHKVEKCTKTRYGAYAIKMVGGDTKEFGAFKKTNKSTYYWFVDEPVAIGEEVNIKELIKHFDLKELLQEVEVGEGDDKKTVTLRKLVNNSVGM